MLYFILSDGINRVQTERLHQAPLKCNKKCPPTPKIGLYLHSSTRTSMTCRKEKKFFEDQQASASLGCCVTCACGNKDFYF